MITCYGLSDFCACVIEIKYVKGESRRPGSEVDLFLQKTYKSIVIKYCRSVYNVLPTHACVIVRMYSLARSGHARLCVIV